MLLCFFGCNSNTGQQPAAKPPASEPFTSFTPEKQPDSIEVSIEGIVYDKDNPLVIINGQLLSKQDEIEGMRIVEISPSAVTLQDPQTNVHIVKELPKSQSMPQGVDDQAQDPAISPKTSYAFVQAKIIEGSEALLYLPAKISSSQKYPLLVVLPADGNVQAAFRHLQGICQKHKWIMLVSKKFQDGLDMRLVINSLALDIDKLSALHPIDTKRVIVTGFSAGATGAHFFSWSHPHIVSGIIVNSGMMHETFRDGKLSYPGGKYAVFLASPTDFSYQQMQADRRFLEQLGWQVKWIEFKGGHALAGQSEYEEAIQWLKIKLY